MALVNGSGYPGTQPCAYDDEHDYEEMPPQMIGQIRDYIARNLRVDVYNLGVRLQINVKLEDVTISECKIDKDELR